ncbi:hypothetical protein [Mycobacteroides abscessus]|uniref:hypothetical protein n=1 Tax=Mycobacteroides abscessus TaxID=36809 RepID=UPI00092A7005|nr:hypothetical protein [Mycobacteroides abscessus]SHO82676.1 Uncharacterised protein [Mycobacteroides abscessus subsp. abscessus]SHP25678.1 Uncharacterised protein [Mycobacteroides abscessus subsp. abscessus]SHP72058.1 Uncharacterised protein [Mycobacteroides abscessus subsp. abscessus]SHQ92295.1 Uncharacterised protein [Mycobacteroides abscessus subsp. abscessus]SHQ99989.1 Uncharacterised protein [Mycobacteroides abscessus subsp. abscessus]
MMISQSRPGATKLVGLVVAASVSIGAVGCSTHPTTSGPISTGETSSSVAAANLVDVSAVWASHPLPPCPRVIIGNVSAPAGLELPSDESVARQLAGVRSPGPPQWVRTKLGWVTKELSATRAGVVDTAGTAGAEAQVKDFQLYIDHIRAELTAGHDIPSDLDETYPEGC